MLSRQKIEELTRAMLAGDIRTPSFEVRIREGNECGTGYCLQSADGSCLTVVVVNQQKLPTARELRTKFKLTPRESEIALLLCERRTNKEIAKLKGFTRYAAARHTEHILAKLGVPSRKDVVEVLRKAS